MAKQTGCVLDPNHAGECYVGTKTYDCGDAQQSAEIAQLRADLAHVTADLDEAIEDRRQARDDAARAAALLAVRTMERDARRLPSAETLEFIRYRIESYEAFGSDDTKRWRDAIDWVCDTEDALRAHAAKAEVKR